MTPLLDRFSLTDKAAIVTGAGRGIGAATALALAEAGADVVIASRTKEQLEEVAAGVADRGRRAAVVPCDLSDTDNLNGLVDTAMSEFGRVDVVVNNVGGTEPRPFLDMSDRGFAAYGTAKAALAHLTRLMATDLAPRVRVNAIAVGSVATSALEIVLTMDELRTEMVERTPLKRLGEVEDIAIAALYLASPASSFVTGKILEVDGGIEYPNLGLNLPDL